MEPLALEGRAVRLRTGELEVATDVLTSAFVPIELNPLQAQANVDSRLTTVGLGRAMIGAVGFGTPMHIVTGEIEHYHLNVATSGRSLCDPGTTRQMHTGPGVARIFVPGERADEQWTADARQVCVRMDADAVQWQLAALLGEQPHGPLRFPGLVDMRAPSSGTWMQVLRMLDRELREPSGLLDHDLSRQTLERLLIDTLLIGQEHSHSELLTARTGSVGGRGGAYAVELMRDRPEQPWSIATLAAEAGCSARALHIGFRAATGQTPMAFLRGVRLDRVRRQLLDIERPPVSVGSVARQWGFVHLGRFSATYQQEYGELPGETLRRRNSPGHA